MFLFTCKVYSKSCYLVNSQIPSNRIQHVLYIYSESKMAFCVHRYIISHVTYEDFLPGKVDFPPGKNKNGIPLKIPCNINTVHICFHTNTILYQDPKLWDTIFTPPSLDGGIHRGLKVSSIQAMGCKYGIP